MGLGEMGGHLALNAMQFTGPRDDGHAPSPLENIFSGILSGRCRGACLPNLKFVSLAVLELLAFKAHNLQGHVTITMPPVRKFLGIMPGLSWEHARQSSSSYL